MIFRVTLAICAAKIEDCMEGRLTHEELCSWAREAMIATDIPPAEYDEIMSLLQDINASTKETLRVAFKQKCQGTTGRTKIHRLPEAVEHQDLLTKGDAHKGPPNVRWTYWTSPSLSTGAL